MVETFDHVPGEENDQVSPMFISEHQGKTNWADFVLYSIHYLTGQNQGLSGLKNIWRVIMTGDSLSIIFSPNNEYWVSFTL